MAIDFSRTITIKNGEEISIRHEFAGAEEYIDFLRRSDLGQQYPREDFHQRITALVQNVQISLIARNQRSQIIGVCLGLTDFAYWLMVTDLGIDRDYAKQGLGTVLMQIAHDLAGGERNIIVFAYANDSAIPFYKKIGMQEAKSMMIKDKIDYTSFVVE